MDISIEYHGDKFNISLHSKEGADPFIVIKGCKIVEGQKGPFISYPATKMANGKYWNHVYGGEKFNAAVIAKLSVKPKPAKQAQQDEDDAPF
jgi:DNA-binding cell septation regulator SpoVG